MKKQEISDIAKKLLNKTIYIIEYIISFLLVKEIFGISVTKASNRILSVK